MKEKCLKLLSEYRDRATVQMTRVMGNFSRSWRRKVVKPICWQWTGWTAVQKVGYRGSQLESLPGWHVSDTGEVWRQILCWCTAVQSSIGRYGDLEEDALRNMKNEPVEADASVISSECRIQKILCQSDLERQSLVLFGEVAPTTKGRKTIYKHQNWHTWLCPPSLSKFKIWLESVHGGFCVYEI